MKKHKHKWIKIMETSPLVFGSYLALFQCEKCMRIEERRVNEK